MKQAMVALAMVAALEACHGQGGAPQGGPSQGASATAAAVSAPAPAP